MNGVPLLNPFANSSAAATTKCSSPAQMNVKEFKELVQCILDSAETNAFIGVALDGHPIYNLELFTENDLDICHGVIYKERYVYVLSSDFPYMMPCLRRGNDHAMDNSELKRKLIKQCRVLCPYDVGVTSEPCDNPVFLTKERVVGNVKGLNQIKDKITENDNLQSAHSLKDENTINNKEVVNMNLTFSETKNTQTLPSKVSVGDLTDDQLFTHSKKQVIVNAEITEANERDEIRLRDELTTNKHWSSGISKEDITNLSIEFNTIPALVIDSGSTEKGTSNQTNFLPLVNLTFLHTDKQAGDAVESNSTHISSVNQAPNSADGRVANSDHLTTESIIHKQYVDNEVNSSRQVAQETEVTSNLEQVHYYYFNTSSATTSSNRTAKISTVLDILVGSTYDIDYNVTPSTSHGRFQGQTEIVKDVDHISEQSAQVTQENFIDILVSDNTPNTQPSLPVTLSSHSPGNVSSQRDIQYKTESTRSWEMMSLDGSTILSSGSTQTTSETDVFSDATISPENGFHDSTGDVTLMGINSNRVDEKQSTVAADKSNLLIKLLFSTTEYLEMQPRPMPQVAQNDSAILTSNSSSNMNGTSGNLNIQESNTPMDDKANVSPRSVVKNMKSYLGGILVCVVGLCVGFIASLFKDEK